MLRCAAMLRYGFRFGGSKMEARARGAVKKGEEEERKKEPASERAREKDGLPKSLEGWNHGGKNRNQSHWLKAAPSGGAPSNSTRVCVYLCVCLRALPEVTFALARSPLSRCSFSAAARVPVLYTRSFRIVPV